MKENKKFTSSFDFNDYVLSYMLSNQLNQAYVSLRYGYTKEKLDKLDYWQSR